MDFDLEKDLESEKMSKSTHKILTMFLVSVLSIGLGIGLAPVAQSQVTLPREETLVLATASRPADPSNG